MNYLIKNAKGVGSLVFLLCVMALVNYALEQKEQKVIDAYQKIIPLMLHKIKVQCDRDGGFKINGLEYTCIPRDAV